VGSASGPEQEALATGKARGPRRGPIRLHSGGL